MEKKKKKPSLILKGIHYFHIFLLAKKYVRKYYDKEILKSKWFASPHKSLGAQGWNWVVVDTKANKKLKKIGTAKWPHNPSTTIINGDNIFFDYNDLNIFQSPGCYFQAIGRITIGSGTWIGPNVGIITSNHDIYNLEKHSMPQNVIVGEKCWIGMNSVILPGVVLGDHTIVGAGSVVTKSFPDGNCLVAGSPAKIVKFYEKN